MSEGTFRRGVLAKGKKRKTLELRGFPISPGVAIGKAAVFDEA